VKLPTNRIDAATEVGRFREGRVRRKKIREEKGRRKKIKGRKKVEKSRSTAFSNVLGLRRVEK